MKLQIRVAGIDTIGGDYYLYEVISDNMHYLVSRSQEELDEQDQDTWDYSTKYELIEREEFTDKEWEIAKYLFEFLWTSDNGTNTMTDQEQYEEEGITREEMEQFIDKFKFDEMGVLDMYEDGGVEIYWDYLCCFDLMTCNPWEDQ